MSSQTVTNNDSPVSSKQNGQIAAATNTILSSILNKSNVDLNMSIEEIYKLTREFVKAKEGTKAFQLTYDDRNMMNVLTKQINNCKLDEESKKVGFLDLVGKDRLQLWKTLGDLPKEQAMKTYIELISRICPLFVAHLEAHFKHLEQEKLKLLEEEKIRREMSEQKEKKLREEDLRLLEENKKRREEMQRKQIQEALNQQTYPHFKAYAEQQHPNNTQAQEELIKQLQEQHFEQYMNQVYQQQLLHQQQQAEQLRAMKRAQKQQQQHQPTNIMVDDQLKLLNLNDSQSLNTSYSALNNSTNSASNIGPESVNVLVFTEKEQKQQQSYINVSETTETFKLPPNAQVESSMAAVAPTGVGTAAAAVVTAITRSDRNATGEEDDENDEIELPPISAASMITRKDIKEFKESVRRDNDAIIKVGSGETVTVRVPTHEDGRLIFWEFATDFYDLGFGLYFEWTISPSNNVTVHVSDSSEDEDGDGEQDGETTKSPNDVEKGDKKTDNKPPVDEIIPIFRRDCHEEVYAGSHLYPGRGVYLLKFDNSYSLWRSKTLYYRVYYSK